jgi:hypothetical protein
MMDEDNFVEVSEYRMMHFQGGGIFGVRYRSEVPGRGVSVARVVVRHRWEMLTELLQA